MNLFTILREYHGQECVKEFRTIEQLHRKLARFRNHLRFNLRCRDEQVVPASLRIKNPIPTRNADQIVRRARDALVRERIRCTANQLNLTEGRLVEKQRAFKECYPVDSETEEIAKQHLECAYEREFRIAKLRQVNKLQTLTSTQKEDSHSDARDKWVCNLSKRELTDMEKSVLSRGLNFATTPIKVPYDDFIIATELACHKITDPGQKADLRNSVAGILKNAKITHKNTSREEWKAIQSIAKDKTIKVLPADKGRTTVILDTEQYENKMLTMLQDETTYEVLKKDPTEDKKKKLKTLLKPLVDEGKINKDNYNFLVPSASITPRIYGTIKIHKKDYPLRPIVDSIGSVNYNLSKALVEIIKPLLGQTPQHCKNSKQLAKQLTTIRVESDEILISHDVVSLFTKTPVDVTINIVHNRLLTDKTLRKRTNLTVQDIVQLLSFVAKSTYFTFMGTVYRQKEGFAMGDPLSAIMSGFFMEDLEARAIATAPAECRLSLWRRYVDDILEKIKAGYTQTLTDHLNTIDSTGNIKFTHEEEEHSSIAFLDMKIHHNEDGSIKIQVYRKPTHTDQYLLWTSEHPTAHKLSVVRTLFDRTSMITDEQDREEEEKHIKQALKACQYPAWAINRGKEEMKNRKENNKKSSKPESRGMVTLPYVRGITERVQQVMRRHHINTPVKPYTKLRQVLVHPKDQIPPDKKCDVIYEIPCRNCDKTYIGETGRQFSTRKKEHQKECEKETSGTLTRALKEKALQENLKSAVSDHCKRENHLMDWDAARIVKTESNKFQRWIKEAVEIRKRAPKTVNRDEGAYQLSHTWDTVLQRRPLPTDRPPDGRGRHKHPPAHAGGPPAHPPTHAGGHGHPTNHSGVTSI